MSKKLLILDLNSALFHPGTQALEIGVESALNAYSQQGWIVVATTYLGYGETMRGAISRYRNILKLFPALRRIYCTATPSSHWVISPTSTPWFDCLPLWWNLSSRYQARGSHRGNLNGLIYPSHQLLCFAIADWAGTDYFIPQRISECEPWDLRFVSNRAPLNSAGIEGCRYIDTKTWHEQIRTNVEMNKQCAKNA